MRLHRFIRPVDLSERRLLLTDGELLSQVKRVLRLRPDDEFLLSDGKGKEARAKIISLAPKNLEVEVVEVFERRAEPLVYAVLYMAVLKRENFVWVVQKAVEVGVSEIVPVFTRRTVKTGLKLDRLQKIAKEAAEQAGRGKLPEVREPVIFEAAVAAARNNEHNYFFDVDAKHPFVMSASGGRVGLFIGPEGGWEPDEIALIARVSHIELATLGPLTLRAETAAVVASYLAASAKKA